MRGQLTRNSLFALGQSLTVAACMFLAYRLVIAHAGLERFGVWSLLLAGSAFARIGDVSGGGALARFVALASRVDGSSRARTVVHTVLLSSFAFNAAIGLGIWVAAPYALPLLVAPAYMAEAQALIPYVVASIVLGALAVAITSGIDGAQRADQRALVVSIAALALLGACAVLVPRYGVVGFGAAQVSQNAVLLVLGWLVLRRRVTDLGWFPYQWRRAVFTETTGYAVKLNAIGVAGALSDPLAKFAFNHVGGPGLVAIYELALRLVIQIRSLTVAAATPLVPAFAAQAGPSDVAFRLMFEKASRVVAVTAIGTAVMTLAAAPIVSMVVLGRYSTELLGMIAALTAGYSINILSVPIYLAGQAFGVLLWNFLSQAVMAAAVLIGVFALSPFWGVLGLVGAVVFGVVFGSLVVFLGNGQAFNVMDILFRLRWYLLGSSFIIVLLCSITGLGVVLNGI